MLSPTDCGNKLAWTLNWIKRIIKGFKSPTTCVMVTVLSVCMSGPRSGSGVNAGSLTCWGLGEYLKLIDAAIPKQQKNTNIQQYRLFY